MQQKVKISKFLSYVLRHKPQSIGLELDPEGWAHIDELMAKADITFSRQTLEEVVSENDKQHFAISSDGQYIRANQGHSIKVELGLDPVTPPDRLFHGTATRFLPSIMKDGLLPKARHHVHMSTDVETASKVGKRHGQLVVLQVDCKAMVQDGHVFFCSENGVWLTDAVPAIYLKEVTPTQPSA